MNSLREYCINSTRKGCYSQRNMEGKRGGGRKKGDRDRRTTRQAYSTHAQVEEAKREGDGEGKRGKKNELS